MDELKQARKEIDAIDEELAALFERRMAASAAIASYKKEHGLPVFDAKRETEIIEEETKHIQKPELREYYVSFLRDLMKVSRSYQTKLLEGAKYAYCGIPGAYAFLAGRNMSASSTLVSYPTFEKAYKAVLAGECDGALLPLENSSAGDVGQVMDLAFSGELHLTRMIDLEISHSLLAKPGVKKEEIREVWSHPQALAQCDDFLKELGVTTVESSNTAVACQSLLASPRNDVGVIASPQNAEIYGLDILEKSINSIANNTTRFGLFSRCISLPSPSTKDQFSVLVFTVKNEAGSLAKALNIIGAHGFNMRNVRSRPLKGLIWNYYFYVELEGNINTLDGKEMLEELSTFCDKLKLLGTYSREDQ